MLSMVSFFWMERGGFKSNKHKSHILQDSLAYRTAWCMDNRNAYIIEVNKKEDVEDLVVWFMGGEIVDLGFYFIFLYLIPVNVMNLLCVLTNSARTSKIVNRI